MKKYVTVEQHDFLTAIAQFINNETNGYFFSFSDIVEMMRLQDIYKEAAPAFIGYILQFKYEDYIGDVSAIYRSLLDSFCEVYDKEPVEGGDK